MVPIPVHVAAIPNVDVWKLVPKSNAVDVMTTTNNC
jgi:hypothetical protein